MAAKAIDIQTRKRKSKRIRAANKFLSNITLDGKLPSDKNKKDAEKIKEKQSLSLDKDEIQLISNQSFVQDPQLARPKLLTSFSTTDAIEENKSSLDIAGSVSSTSTFQFNISLEHACLFNRASSLRESKHLQNNVVCGRNLTKVERQLCGKRCVIRQ